MRVVICDDEIYYTDAVCSSIKRWQEARNSQALRLDIYHSSEDLNDILDKSIPYDLAFLDIQFPGELNGLALAQRFRGTNRLMDIVFMTNYEEYAIDGYKVNALRFLPKPVSDRDVFECLDIAYRRWHNTQKASMLIDSSQQLHRLEYTSILYIESRAHYAYFRLCDRDNEIKARMKLTELLGKLPKDIFIQCHRSYLVNLLFVNRISKNEILLSNNDRIPISSKFWRHLHNSFMFFYQGGICRDELDSI